MLCTLYNRYFAMNRQTKMTLKLIIKRLEAQVSNNLLGKKRSVRHREYAGRFRLRINESVFVYYIHLASIWSYRLHKCYESQVRIEC